MNQADTWLEAKSIQRDVMAKGLMKSIPCTHNVRVTISSQHGLSRDHTWLIDYRGFNFSGRPSFDVFNNHISTKEVRIGIGTSQREAYRNHPRNAT